jgi:hypothetical protein
MGCMELGTCYLIWGRGVKRSCLTGRHHLVPRTCGDEGAAILRLRGEDMRHFEDINIACKFFTAYSGITSYHLVPLQLILLSSAFTPPRFGNVKYTHRN